jgi:1,4-alpha-glucan branching enzyme
MYAQPGKKLLFMGAEIGQHHEWDHDASVSWHLLEEESHRGVQRWVDDLNRAYRSEPALHELDCDPAGFEWIDASDSVHSVLGLLRKGRSGPPVLVVCNFTPVPHTDYRVGAPHRGFWREILNSDAPAYGGSGWGNMGGVEAVPVPFHGRPCSLALTLPPLAAVFLRWEGEP